MKPWKTLGEAHGPDGTRFVLAERSGETAIRVGGVTLMSSRAHHSEEEMARLVCARLAKKAPRVLIGGLGMGFTLRAALDALPPEGRVLVVELLEPVARWNRGPLGPPAGRPLEDPRVELYLGDVGERIEKARGSFDAILLDVDNGPEPLSRRKNKRLYLAEGLAAARGALAEGGLLALWSASPDPVFRARFAKVGFRVEAHRVSAFASLTGAARGKMHVLYVGTKR